MGAWGTGSFENDAAIEWARTLEESDGFAAVERALDDVVSAGSTYLDSDVGGVGIAAAAIVVHSLGKGSPDDTAPEVESWIESNELKPPPALVEKAIRVVERVAGKKSELSELWGDSEDVDAWKASIKALVTALKSAGARGR